MKINDQMHENLKTISHAICKLSAGKRHIIAIAGPPATGKSTLAENLCQYLNDNSLRKAALLPMDGYHYDDVLLKKLGRYARKGAADTFDVAGLKHMLQRLRLNKEENIVTPLFDRDLEIARAGAQLIEQQSDIILVEGNYLLVDQQPWSDLGAFFDLTVFIDEPIEILKQRLRQRWIDQNFDEDGILRKLKEVDLPNGEFIRNNSRKADIVFSSFS